MLKLSYLAFKDLISANDELLEIIADIETRLDSNNPFGMTYIRYRAVACATHAYRMIMCLDKLSSRRYQELHLVFDSIRRRIDAALGERPLEVAPSPLVYPLSVLDAGRAEKVGGKAANAGEMSRAGLPVPDGFAVSADAFAAWLRDEDLGQQARTRILGLDRNDQNALEELSRALQQRIISEDVPDAIADAITAAYEDLCLRTGGRPSVAVRSSAVGEDGQISFAGQYSSVLNVGPERILGAYREVVASLYSTPALFYRSLHGIAEEDCLMGVLCMVLIDAAASGGACSVDPAHPDSDTLLIAGSAGLGVATAGGAASPDTWEVRRSRPPAIVSARAGWERTSPVLCLSEAQVCDLARLVLSVEAHFESPQELEWALDRNGRFWLLQSRPLHVARLGGSSRSQEEDPDREHLLLTGTPASPGCAAGPAHHLSESDDAASFPQGGVLVARHSSPRFVKVMGRAAAIVTDIGATTGHMASLAREFGVPAVLDTRIATACLGQGQVVTVDADRGSVYNGRLESRLSVPAASPGRPVRETPIAGILRQVADAVVPLNLTDPRDPMFRPGNCRTLHDIARFAHEKAFEEMFRMSDRVADVTRRAVRLDEKLPFQLYLIDLGGGIRTGAASPSVRAEDLASEPLQALVTGMTNPALRWWEPRGVSISGFLSVATESLMAPRQDQAERYLGERSYAIVAEGYCNFSSRIGYHFAAIDAYCTGALTRNYISFRFKGGAADEARRTKRCELIGAILKRLDFQLEQSGDLVNARLRKFPRETILDRLDQLGRLVVATRQMDMRMAPGAPVDWFVQAFLDGNYGFDQESAGTAGRRAPQ
jgi:pyruvate,water dikinase